MRTDPLPDEGTVEALLSGRSVAAGDDLAPVATFLEDLRSLARDPAPAPSAALASFLSRDVPTQATAEAVRPEAVRPDAPTKRRSRTMTAPKTGLAAKLAGMGLAARIALGGGVALAGVTTAGAAGVLPEGPQQVVGGAIETVTPFDVSQGPVGAAQDEIEDVLDEVTTTTSSSTTTSVVPTTTTTQPGGGLDDGPDGGDEPAPPAPRNHGACVSAVAQDKSLEGREHGKAVSEMARSDCGKQAEVTPPTPTPDDDGDGGGEVAGQGSGPGNGHGNSNGNGQGRGRGSSHGR